MSITMCHTPSTLQDSQAKNEVNVIENKRLLQLKAATSPSPVASKKKLERDGDNLSVINFYSTTCKRESNTVKVQRENNHLIIEKTASIKTKKAKESRNCKHINIQLRNNSKILVQDIKSTYDSNTINSDNTSIQNNNVKDKKKNFTKERNKGEKPKVKFGKVEERQYERQFGGSCGVPDEGNYPLGLGWNFVCTTSSPFSSCDYDRNEEKKTLKKNVQFRCFSLTERERRNLLLYGSKESPRRIYTRRSKRTKKSLKMSESEKNYDETNRLKQILNKECKREAAELKVIRFSRLKTGCSCTSSKACTTSNCSCFKNSLKCHEAGCHCSYRICGNPLGTYTFNEEEQKRHRKKVLSCFKKQTLNNNKK